jgi:hypothetical protein
MADPKTSPEKPLSALSAAASVRKTGVALTVTIPAAGAGLLAIGSANVVLSLAKILFTVLNRENEKGLSGKDLSFINEDHMPEIIDEAGKKIVKFSARSLQGILQENAEAFGYEKGSVPDLATIWTEDSVHHRKQQFKNDFGDGASIELDAAERHAPDQGTEQGRQAS